MHVFARGAGERDERFHDCLPYFSTPLATATFLALYLHTDVVGYCLSHPPSLFSSSRTWIGGGGKRETRTRSVAVTVNKTTCPKQAVTLRRCVCVLVCESRKAHAPCVHVWRTECLAPARLSMEWQGNDPRGNSLPVVGFGRLLGGGHSGSRGRERLVRTTVRACYFTPFGPQSSPFCWLLDF